MKRLVRWLSRLPMGVQLAIIAAEITTIIVLSLGITDGSPQEDPAGIRTSSGKAVLSESVENSEESVSSDSEEDSESSVRSGSVITASESADEEVTVSSTVEAESQEEVSEKADVKDVSAEKTTTPTAEPSVEASKDNAEGVTGARETWGRNGKRYTVLKEAKTLSEWASQKRVQISNSSLFYNISDSDRSRISRYVSAYAGDQQINADSAEILGTQYMEDGSIREFYISFNDEAGSLAAIVYEEPDGENEAYIDVVPCSWTRKQIEEQAWVPKESTN